MYARSKIMLVEDDMVLCKVLEDVLTQNGYEVLPPAHNYNDAVQLLLAETPDIALLDIGLPGGKDGVELAGFIYQHTSIPVVFMTGYNDDITMQRAKKSHAHSVVFKTKPVLDENGLAETVAKQLMTSVYFALPGEPGQQKMKTLGLLLKTAVHQTYKQKQDTPRPADLGNQLTARTFLAFNNILYITANNKHVHNTVGIIMANGNTEVHRGSLAELEKDLPAYFVRTRDSQIVNITKVTQCIADKVLFIEGERFDVSEKYEKAVYEKKRLYLSHLL